jgi:hypothetical protein
MSKGIFLHALNATYTRNVSAVGINIGMILTGMNLLKKLGFDLALLYNPYPEQKKNIATIG